MNLFVELEAGKKIPIRDLGEVPAGSEILIFTLACFLSSTEMETLEEELAAKVRRPCVVLPPTISNVFVIRG